MSHRSHLPVADQDTLTLAQDQLPPRKRTPRHQLVVAPEHLARCGGDLWQAHALTLAEKAHLLHTVTSAQWVNRHALPAQGEPFGPGVELFHVPSASEPWRHHTVTYDATTDRYHCDCISGSYAKPCKHVGAVCDLILTVRESRTPQARQGQLDYDAFWQRQGKEWDAE